MHNAESNENGTKSPAGETTDILTGEHDLSVLYSCSFPLSKPGGKSAGTRRKLRALRRLCRSLTVIAPPRAGNAWAKVGGIVGTETRTLAILLRQRKQIDIYISRAFSGVLAVFLARILGITTAREIHADSYEEALILAPGRGLKRGLLKFTATITHWIDRVADIRFFNHPALLHWFADSGWLGPHDVAVYNGGRRPAAILSPTQRRRLRQTLALPADHTLLVFTGSAAPWHGIELLVELQKCFNRHADPVRIVCAGGPTKPIDPRGLMINVSPALEAECDRLVQAADFCLLPVRQDRRSPGSPIKLFDYLMHKKRIITQQDVQGYSDIVEGFGAGILVDFKDIESTRAKILEAIPEDAGKEADISEMALQTITWQARMESWLRAVETSRASMS